jgi:hypothetical protein
MAAKAVYEALAQEAMQLREFGRAEGYLREYLGAAARYVPFLELLGQACEAQGKTAEAVAELIRAVSILLEFPDPEDRIHAERLYEKAKALAPDHSDVAKLAAAFAPTVPPPQEPAAPETEPIAPAPTDKAMASDSPAVTAEPRPTASNPETEQAAKFEPLLEQHGEASPTLPPMIAEALANAPPPEREEAASIDQPAPSQPEPTAVPAPEPIATSAPVASSTASEALSVSESTAVAADSPLAVHASSVAASKPTGPTDPGASPTEAEADPPPHAGSDCSDVLGALTPRLADIVDSAARTKPEEPVELISLEDWMHEPLSPEPLAKVHPKPAVRAKGTAISLPDQSRQAGLLGGQATEKKRTSRGGSSKSLAAIHEQERRAQIEMRSVASSIEQVPVFDRVDPAHPESLVHGASPAAESGGSGNRLLEAAASSRHTQQEEDERGTGGIDVSGSPAEQTGAEAKPLGPDPSQTEAEPAQPVAHDQALHAPAPPITALDPDLRAELETFLREKTPLTDRAQVFSPFAESQPGHEPVAGETGPSAQEEPQAVSAVPDEPAVSGQSEEFPDQAPLDAVFSAPEQTDSSQPQEPEAAESIPVPAEPEIYVAPEAQPVAFRLQIEPEPAPLQSVEEAPVADTELMPLETVPHESVSLMEAQDPASNVPSGEPEPSLASVDQSDTHEVRRSEEKPPPAPVTFEEARSESPAPLEESPRTPLEESAEAPNPADEPLPDFVEEPFSEQMSEPDHNHEAQPCSLCQEAETEEALQRKIEALDATARRPSGPRLPRPLRQVTRWVRAGVLTVTDTALTATRLAARLVLVLATMGLGLPLLAVSLVTATWLVMEEKPNANFLELTQAPPRPVEEPTRNGYYLLLGLGAGESVDPLKAGYHKWKTTQGDQSRQCFGLATGNRPSMAFTAETRVLGLWLQSHDPVSELLRERSLVRRWAVQHGLLMARYRQWLAMPFEDRGYGSFASPDCDQVLTAHRLYLADGFAHRPAEGMDRLERDLIAWRNVLARSKTMAMKLLAAHAVREDVAILTAIVEQGTTDSGTLPRFAHLVRPFDQVERSLRWPMQNELLLEVRRVESRLTADRDVESGWLTKVVAHLPLPKQRTLNSHADYYEALIRTPEQGSLVPPDPYTYTNSPAQDALDYLVNPVDNLLLGPDQLSWQHEASVLSDADTRLRTLVAARAFQPNPTEPVTAKAQPQSAEGVPTLVSEISPL